MDDTIVLRGEAIQWRGSRAYHDRHVRELLWKGSGGAGRPSWSPEMWDAAKSEIHTRGQIVKVWTTINVDIQIRGNI